MTSSSVLINLLGRLTEFRGTFYLLDCWLIIKGYNSGTARWKRCIGQGMWEGAQRFHALSGWTTLPEFPLYVLQPGAIRTHPFRFLWRLLLQRREWLNHWLLLIELNLQLFPSPIPGGQGWNGKFHPLITWLVFLATSTPILSLPKGFPKATPFMEQKTPP